LALPKRLLGYLALAAFLALIPFIFPSDYHLHIIIIILINTILALSIRLVFLGGEITLGHAAFMGIGAYTSALLATRWGLDFWLCLPLAAAAAALMAVPMGMLTLRVKGLYFAIVTLAFAETFRIVVAMWRSFTGGVTGILNIPAPTIQIGGLVTIEFGSKASYYYLALALLAVTIAIMYRLDHSQFGLTLAAIRESDVLSESVGINVVRYKIIAFVIGCAFAGVAGSFVVHYLYYVSPADFTMHRTLSILLYPVFGGLGSVAGSVLGAAILTTLPEAFRVAAEYEPAVFGIILIITIWRLPQGLWGLGQYMPWSKAK